MLGWVSIAYETFNIEGLCHSSGSFCTLLPTRISISFHVRVSHRCVVTLS